MKNNPLRDQNLTDAAIVILPHINPDGDTIGSALAIYEYLRTRTERAWIVLDDSIPFDLSFLNVSCLTEEAFNQLNVEPDLVFCMDSSDLGRLGTRQALLKRASKIINIDHHKTNIMYGDVNVVLPEASSTGEVVFELLEEVGATISKEMATALYVAISTDTGSFKYSNTQAKTMRISAELIESGIDLNTINTELYQNKPLDKIHVLKAAMKNLRLEDEGRLALTYITLQDMEELKITTLDTDGVAEFFRDIHGVEVVILLKEKEKNVFKGSLRSKHQFDVAELALKYGGGGHAKAAGLTLGGSLSASIDKLLSTYNEMAG
jgi:phosphoesterase RecJ-like protein